MTTSPKPVSEGTPSLIALIEGRPQIRAQTSLGGCLGMMGVVMAVVWLVAQALWPPVMLPQVWAQAGAVAAGGLAGTLFCTPAGPYTRSPCYRLLTTVPAWQVLPHHWWRALLLLAWLPGILVVAGASWVQGTTVSGWWATFAGGMALVAFVVVHSALILRQPVFLHPQGIQASLTYFHTWARIRRIRVEGSVLALDIDRLRSHPPYVMVLPEPALTEVLAEARRRGIAIEAGLPGMWLGKAASLAVALGLGALAWALVAAGCPWPLAAAGIIAVGIPVKLAEEWLTGISSLTRNQLKVQNITGILDAEVFTDRWMERMSSLHPQHELEIVAPLHFRSREGGGAWMDHHLDRAYQLYTAEPGRLDDILAEFLDSAAEAAALGPVEAERLIPAVRDRSLAEQMQAQLAARAGPMPTEAADPPASGPVQRALGGDLVVLLAENHPRTIRFVDAGNLADLGLDADAAFARAKANLAHLVPERPVEGSDGFYGIAVPFHAGALLLDEAWLTQSRFPVEGDLLVALPNRDLALVTGTGEEQGLRLLAAALRESSRDPHHGSTQVLRRTAAGSWEPYDLPA